MNNYIKLCPELKKFLEENKPIVALESSIFAHGLPYPLNVDTFKRTQEAVLELGVLPVTIGVIDGYIVAGLNSEHIESFASNPKVIKVTNRNIASTLVSKKMGATTISASMNIAEILGIKFFASAGLGGVHRGFSESLDISADLIELTKRKLAVVSAGIKPILDIPASLEFLETQGVPVVSYSTDDFPAFYFKSSGIKTVFRSDDLSQISELIKIYWNLGNHSSYLITAPIENDYALNKEEIESVIVDTLKIAEKNNISGHALTPFLMSAIGKSTNGKTLQSNCEVYISNAVHAAKLAIEFYKN